MERIGSRPHGKTPRPDDFTMIILLFFLLFILSSSAEAAVIYWVSPNGTAGSCISSATQPPLSSMRNTIDGGVSCLASGDTLNVMPGNYVNQTVWSIRNSPGSCDQGVCPPNGSAGAYTTIQAAPGFELQATFSLAGDKLMRMQGYVSYIAIKNLRLDASQGVGSQGGMINGDCAGPLFDCKTGGVLDEEKAPHHITFEGNEIFGPSNYVAQQMPSGIHGFGTGSIFRGNHIYNFGHSQFEHGIYTTGDILAENNRIHDIAGYGVQVRRCDTSQPGCTQPQIQNAVIRNNLFYNLANAGVVTEWGPHYVYNNSCRDNSKCVQVSYSDNNQIFNNTSWRDSTGCIVVGPGGGNNVVRNNLCMGSHSEGDIFIQNSPDPTFNNTLTNNFSQSSLTGLVDPANDNFQLQSSFSSALNQGLNLSSISLPLSLGQPTIDAAGTSRPQGSQWDIGACERPASGTIPVCPSLQSVTPPVSQPTITITSPVASARYITTTQNQILQGTYSCGAGTLTSVTWSNNQGGSGSAVAAGDAWSMTGTGATLTPYQINRITVTLTCSGTSPTTATDTLDIAYNPAELIGAYSFDENSGTAPQDSSGKGNHGSFGAGVAYTTTKQKYGTSGLDFSGGSVTIPQNGNNNKIIGGFSFVISGVNPDAVHTDFRALIINNYAERLYGQWPGSILCQAAGVHGSFGFNDNNIIGCTPPVQVGLNSCVAVTYNGATLDVYINKILISTQTRDYELPNQPTGSWQIGNSTFSEPWDGGIDEVRIYNYGINSAQVTTDCDTQIGGAPPAPATSLKIGTVGIKIGDKDLKLGF